MSDTIIIIMYLQELWSEAVNYGTKRQTVSERRRHVLYVNIVVIFTLHSAPLLQSLQRSHHDAVFLGVVYLRVIV